MRWDPITRLFRVYEGGGGSPQSTTTTNQLFSPEEARRREKVMGEAERLYGETAGQIRSSPYPGAKPQQASQDTMLGRDAMRSYATGAGQDLASQTMAASKFGMSDVLYPESNPALRATQAAAIRPITEAYTDPGGVFSNIRGDAQQMGGVNQGSRQGIAEGIAGRGYLDTIGDVSSRIAYEGYNKGLDTMSKTMALAPQTMQLGMMPGQIQSAVGQQGEAYAQSQEDYDAASRQWELNAPWLPLQNYANIVFGGGSPGTESISSGAGAGGNKTVGALGGAAAGAYLGSQVYPGWGTAIGAGIGLLAAYLS